MTPVGEAVPSFEFATPARIVFGAGRSKEIGTIASEFGRRALVVTGSHPERARPTQEILASAGLASETYSVVGEPSTLDIATGLARARLKGCDLVIGFGGGSAIDAAKAIAGLLTNDRDLFDCLEVIGRGQPLSRPAAPWIAVPTTAGAGAEVTRNAVLTSKEHRVKASLRSPHLLARVVIVDPELTFALPPATTACTGLDALTQLVEPFVCTRANPVTDVHCLDGLHRVARSLRLATSDGANLPARTDMALAALYGGLALANSGLGSVHGLAAPIGGRHGVPHGAICAALLPHAMALNLAVLRQRRPDSPAVRRYQTIAQALVGCPDASADEGVNWVRQLVLDLRIPPLGAMGIDRASFPDLVEKGLAASSMKANPVSLTREELLALLEAAY